MKTGLVSISFRKLTPEEIIPLCIKAGLSCIEWGGDIHVPAGDLARAREVGEMTRQSGLEVACYGSYDRLAEESEPEKVVQTAKTLGAPLIRVWAGRKGSADADPAYRERICQNAQKMADLAAQEGMDVVFEYHGGTLTDTADSALALLQAANRPNVGTLWQPPVNMSTENCLASIDVVQQYIRNVHVFSWNGTERLPLQGGAAKWQPCLEKIRAIPGEHRLMMEFVQNDAPEQLLTDAACLRGWLEGRWNA